MDENLERLSGLLVSSLLVEEAMMMRMMTIYNVLPLHLHGGGQLVQGHHGRLALLLLLAALLALDYDT